ncbi:hypothetical protein [Bacillus sp. AY2-1]|uniref:hypothetical protein n=1 Tax=Bacillus sp. AY2-1 TaxID=2217828 RepID=UPI0011ED82E1|nr:hypothetical protein [Bacillus sp. AY2-1]KAA0827850.1 hypothetical protein DN403_11315 [Bacillus sp. AY2-1]
MFYIKTIRCNDFGLKEINKQSFIDTIKDVVPSLGYEFVLDLAFKAYLDALGIEKKSPKLDFETDEENSYFERLYFRRFMGSRTSEWSNYCKLRSDKGYVVFHLFSDEDEIILGGEKDQMEMKCNLEVCVIMPEYDESIESELNEIIQLLVSTFNDINEFAEFINKNEKFVELSRTYESVDFEESDYVIAEELYKQDFRTVLQKIRMSGGMFRRDADEKFQAIVNKDLLITKMIELGLLTLEFIILCKKTSEKINVIPEKSLVKELGDRGIRCPHCSTLVNEEHLDEWLTVTELGHQMLNGNHWMTVLLVSVLKKFNINNEDILINVQEGPEEIDAFVHFDNNLLQFELKDKQFSMGNAYAFQSRLFSYSPEIGVIWSTEGVAPEVKENFKKVQSKASILYIKTAQELEVELNRVFNQIREKRAFNILVPLLEHSMPRVNVTRELVNKIRLVKDDSETLKLNPIQN